MLLGAVDLGSNSFRVEIGRLEGDSIHTQNYLKETVRLAGGFDDKGALTPARRDQCGRFFKKSRRNAWLPH